MKITVAKYTDVGNRDRNEDYLAVKAKGRQCYIAVADGLGGHGMGEEASKTACEAAIAYLQQQDSMGNEVFSGVYDECQRALLQRQKEMHAAGQMRTTLNLLCTEGNMAYWSHVGDSRTYYFKDKKLVRRTFDHSVPQMLVAMGELEEKMIRFHEDRNRLLRVLGVEDRPPQFDAEEPVLLTGGQQFLLCSDGFWESITEEQMVLFLEEAEEPRSWLENMVELVRRNCKGKKSDNVTAVAVWIE